MGKKATLSPIVDKDNNATEINTSLNAINDKLENTLSLDGSTPNAMNADLDMNSNDVLNSKTVQAEELILAGKALTLSETSLTSAQTVGIGFNERNSGNATLIAAQPDGTVARMGRHWYLVDSSLTGSASCTNDLSVDGLTPSGVKHIDHYGRVAPITLTSGDILEGNGASGDGLVISSDVQAIVIVGAGDGASNRHDRVQVRDLHIAVQAGVTLTGKLIEVVDAGFGSFDNVYAVSEDQQTAEPCFSIGDDRSDDQAYSWSVADSTARGWDIGLKNKSSGSGISVKNFYTYPASDSSASSTMELNTPNFNVANGQGFIKASQEGNGQEFNGSIESRMVEAVEVGEVALEVTGDTTLGNASSAFGRVVIGKTVRVNGVVLRGTAIKFDESNNCECHAFCENSSSVPAGGLFLHVTANSADSIQHCYDLETAEAPIQVDSGADRFRKRVHVPIAFSQLSDVTTTPNGMTELIGGVLITVNSEQILVHGVFHDGTNWNLERFTSTSDDTVETLNPPMGRGRVSIIHEEEPDDDGVVSFFIDASPASQVLSGTIEAGTGIPTGTTGTNNKSGIYADATGLFLEERNGSGNNRYLMYTAI